MDDSSSPHRQDVLRQQDNTGASLFARIPTEIVEKTIEHLDLSSILNLRRTCRDLAKRAVGPHLLKNPSYQVTRPTIDLSSAKLSRVEEILSSAHFGPVEHLTVQAVVYYMNEHDQQLSFAESGDKMRKLHERLDWLADRRSEQVFSEWDEHQEVILRLSEVMKKLGGLTAESPTLHGGLDLGCVVSAGEGPAHTSSPADSGPGTWNLVALRASQAFYVTMHSIVRSRLQTPSMRIFSQTPRCGVPAGTISWLLRSIDNQDLAHAMLGIKNFALSFAPVVGTRVNCGIQPNGVFPGSQSGDDVTSLFPTRDELNLLEEQALIAVPRFIAMVSADVEVLDLHMYTPTYPLQPEYCRIFANLARDTHFSKLRDCTLRGLSATAGSMVQFLEKHGSHLQRLTLRDIWLPHDSWLPVFRKLQPYTLPNLEYLKLENLFSLQRGEDGLVNLGSSTEERLSLDDTKSASCLHRWHFRYDGGSMFFFAREWDAQAFSLESREAGLEFTDGPPHRHVATASSSLVMFHEWECRRADEFGPPLRDRHRLESEMSLPFVNIRMIHFGVDFSSGA